MPAATLPQLLARAQCDLLFSNTIHCVIFARPLNRTEVWARGQDRKYFLAQTLDGKVWPIAEVLK